MAEEGEMKLGKIIYEVTDIHESNNYCSISIDQVVPLRERVERLYKRWPKMFEERLDVTLKSKPGNFSVGDQILLTLERL